MLSGLLPSSRRAAVRLVVLALAVAGTGPLEELRDWQDDQAGVAATVTQRASADPETSLVTRRVPEAGSAATSADERRRFRAAGLPPRVVAELESTRAQEYGLLGVTWERGTAAKDLVVQVRTRTGEEWTSWEYLEIEDIQKGEGAATRAGTNPTWVGESDGVAVRLLSAHDAPEDVQVALIDGGTGLAEPAGFRSAPALARTTSDQGIKTVAPGGAMGSTIVATTDTTATNEPTPTSDSTATTEPTATTTGVAPKPTVLMRSEWGVDRTYESECSAPIRAPSAKGVVLHHTAGANGYTPEEAPGIVRGIHLYHTRSLGWCDIGYNFLVDAYGVIYAGRRGGQDRQVRGAHAGNWDANLYTTGISMIGNYETAPLTEPMKESVLDLTAWRLSYFGLPAIGTTVIDGVEIDIISGHRDIYTSGIRPATATACPGKYGYEWLIGGMRDEVQARIDAAGGASEEPPPTEEPAPEEPTEEPAPPRMSRMAGGSRYATAATISERTFSATNGAVFLSSGETYPDALSGGPAAAGKSSPILLAQKDRLPSETVAELERLAPSSIYILGGETALSAKVASQASTYADRVIRLAGRDRYATGVAISRKLWSSSDVVYVASGTDYPDALSGGALAARDRAPILLSDTESLPTSVKEELIRLEPARVVLLGGTAALKRTVRNQIAQAVPNAAVSRLSGQNRYATSAEIVSAGWTSSEFAFFAAGTDFPDALAGVPAAAFKGAPLLLTTQDCMPAAVADVADKLAPSERVLLGGAMVLEDSASTARCE